MSSGVREKPITMIENRKIEKSEKIGTPENIGKSEKLKNLKNLKIEKFKIGSKPWG